MTLKIVGTLILSVVSALAWVTAGETTVADSPGPSLRVWDACIDSCIHQAIHYGGGSSLSMVSPYRCTTHVTTVGATRSDCFPFSRRSVGRMTAITSDDIFMRWENPE
ncbi:hypothetical protein EDB84DRAFT_825644 [Lactarius hengduanensis]|nr:hypothetical protein EDB84DRAFT_825644 [Lactarius hengduanensis]